MRSYSLLFTRGKQCVKNEYLSRLQVFYTDFCNILSFFYILLLWYYNFRISHKIAFVKRKMQKFPVISSLANYLKAII